MGRIGQELIGRILFVDRISLSISGWGYWFAKVCWANCKTTTASQSCGHRAGQWKSPCNWSVASRGLWPEKLVRAASSAVVVEGVSSHLASLFYWKVLFVQVSHAIDSAFLHYTHSYRYISFVYIYKYIPAKSKHNSSKLIHERAYFNRKGFSSFGGWTSRIYEDTRGIYPPPNTAAPIGAAQPETPSDLWLLS